MKIIKSIYQFNRHICHFFRRIYFMYELQPVKYEFQIEGFHSIEYFEFGKNFSHAQEKHSFWEMLYIDMGNAIAITNGIGYKMTQGQVIFHEPGEIHAHISDKKTANNMLAITFSISGNAMDFFKHKSFTLDRNAKKLLSLFIREYKLASKDVPMRYGEQQSLDFSTFPLCSTQLLACYLTEFLIYLLRSNDIVTETITNNKESYNIAINSLSELINDYMQYNIYAQLTLQDLCKHFMIGKTQLSALFKQTTGISPMKYYTRLKINEAKRLLRETDYSISKISDMLGYTSIHNFSRAFKNETNFSPSAYQDSIV